jgi:hypothetical protein
VTNAQAAAQVAAQLVGLTNCKETGEITETFLNLFDRVFELLNEYETEPVMKTLQSVNSPRNIPVLKTQEELKMKLNDYTATSGGAVTASMVQSSRPIKKDRPKAHPPRTKGPNLEF